MPEGHAERDEEAAGPVETARKPWFAPKLSAHSVADVTRTGSTSCQNDGTDVYAPSS